VLLARTIVRADGSYDFPQATLPSSLTNGAHTLRVTTTRNGAPAQYTSSVTISGGTAAAPGGTSGLPQTGRDTSMMAIWGVLFVLAGSHLLLWLDSRRARPARATLTLAGEIAPLDPDIAGDDIVGGPIVAGPVARAVPPAAVERDENRWDTVRRVQDAVRDWRRPGP
jgi:LPXTG-motif cell wall-anchored protein